jgi:hypothetical protein
MVSIEIGEVKKEQVDYILPAGYPSSIALMLVGYDVFARGLTKVAHTRPVANIVGAIVIQAICFLRILLNMATADSNGNRDEAWPIT